MLGLFTDISYKELTTFSLEGYLVIYPYILSICYVCYHLLTSRCESRSEDIYSFQYKVFTISYHSFNMPDVL